MSLGACTIGLQPALLSRHKCISGASTHAGCCRLRLSHRQPAPTPGHARRRSMTIQAVSPAIAPQNPAQPGPQMTTEILGPPQIFQKCLDIGIGKANTSATKIFLMGIMGGAFVSIGGFLALTVGMNCPGIASANPGLQKMIFGAFGFPLAVLMVVMTGAELFTGNTFFLPLALLEKRASLGQVLKSWMFSYLGNVVGCLLLVSAVAQTGLLADLAGPTKVAVMKTSLSTSQVLVRSVLANWLVCMAFWLANGANSMVGKIIGIWFPISAFAAMGLEHSVANMFIVPMGIALGAPVSISAFLWNNLLPVSIGNIIAGAICVAVPFALAYGTFGSKST